MKCIYLFCMLLFCFAACTSSKEIAQKYPRMIGDIAYDAKLDKADFQLCAGDDMVNQYYNFGEMPFKLEKIEVLRIFKEQYKGPKAVKDSGLLRIRFVVNCKGETDRFRSLGMDFGYQKKEFDARIAEQLMTITKGIGDWKPFSQNGMERDYYMYFIFKIKDGKIIDIMP